MALRSTMPTRDPGRDGEGPHVREYSARDGGWTRTSESKPVPGTPNGTEGRLSADTDWRNR